MEFVSIRRCGSPNSINLLPLLTATEKVRTLTDLGCNFISTEGNGRILAETLSRRQSYLRNDGGKSILSLDDNNIDDDDLLEFGIALSGNKQGLQINLVNNRITREGVEGFYRQTIFNQHSLNSVADSNHTCVATFDYGEQEDYLHVNNIGLQVKEEDRNHLHPTKSLQ